MFTSYKDMEWPVLWEEERRTVTAPSLWEIDQWYFHDQRYMAHPWCTWEWTAIRRNAVGVVGISINHGQPNGGRAVGAYYLNTWSQINNWTFYRFISVVNLTGCLWPCWLSHSNTLASAPISLLSTYSYPPWLSIALLIATAVLVVDWRCVR